MHTYIYIFNFLLSSLESRFYIHTVNGRPSISCDSFSVFSSVSLGVLPPLLVLPILPVLPSLAHCVWWTRWEKTDDNLRRRYKDTPVEHSRVLVLHTTTQMLSLGVIIQGHLHFLNIVTLTSLTGMKSKGSFLAWRNNISDSWCILYLGDSSHSTAERGVVSCNHRPVY